MVLLGTIVNVCCIIIGSFIGLFFTNIPERYKETIMHAIGLVVVLIGLQMAFSTQVIIVVLLSLMTGALVGEFFQLEDKINTFGEWVGSKFYSKNSNQNVGQAFVTATLLFVIGAMAIIGSLDSGIKGNHEVLITKSIIDGFTTIVLTTTLGFGVILSVIPVTLYQGTITLLATQISKYIPDAVLNEFIIELTAVGGMIIVAIGLNILNITKIKIGNLIPSLLTVVVVYYIYSLF